MVEKIVEERKLVNEKAGDDDHKGSPNDAIDLLLRNTGELSHEMPQNQQQVRLPLDFISSNIVEMIIPGEDSVPMVITLAVKYLSDNPLALSRIVVCNAYPS